MPGTAEEKTEGTGVLPGSVYLCQVNERVSCGACCGLYNVKDLSKSRIESMLLQRTKAFSSVPRTEEGIEAFGKKVEGFTPEKRPFPEFHHCPYLGLVGDERRRVGCMLHPAASGNDGKDFRWLSWYGAMACRVYFCPTHRNISPDYLMIVREVIDHWYPYGLIVTEHRLLCAFFAEVENRIGRRPHFTDFRPRSIAADLFLTYSSLKSDWPYRRKDAPGPCHYMFENGEYDRPSVFRELADIPGSRYEVIFQELDSGFGTAEQMIRAERYLDGLFERIAGAIK